MRNKRSREQAFTRYVKETEPRLSYALAAAYGPEVGAEATADALAYAWEHWERIERMGNPAGYRYRVARAARGAIDGRECSFRPLRHERNTPLSLRCRLR
jgi:hypothetical protein